MMFGEADIGQDEIDAGIAVVAEFDAEIDHDPLAASTIADAIEIAVHADLADTAEWQQHELGWTARRAHHAGARSGDAKATSPAWSWRSVPSARRSIIAPSLPKPSKRPATVRPSSITATS